MQDDKKRILNKLNNGEFILKKFRADEKKSDVWETFSLVISATDGKSQSFVLCNKCEVLLAYVPNKTGTSHLKRHKCSWNTSNQPKLTSFIQQTKVATSAKKDVLNDCIYFCSKDIRPLDVVEGIGFKKLGQTLIDVGAKYGRVKIDDILSHPTTISRHLVDNAQKIKESLLPHLKRFIENSHCSATSDMWTDDFNKTPYITLTLHYIDDDWELQSRVIFTCSFPSDEKKTGENIRKEIIKQLINFGFDSNIMKNLSFVTDQGANIMSALNKYTRYNCCAHLLNTILRNSFNIKDNESKIQNTEDLLEECKHLVTFMKHSGYINLLPKTLKQQVETRWNSRLIMLLSVEEQFENVQEILIAKQEDQRLSGIDRSLMADLIAFLRPFKECTDMLEGDKKVTFSLVTLCYYTILRHLRENEYENEEVNFLKKETEKYFLSKFILTDNHKIATFLHPKFRQLKMLEPDEKLRIINKIKQYLTDSQSLEVVEITKDNEDIHPSKKYRFSEWEDDVDEHKIRKPEEEIYLYQSASFKDEEILKWWKQQSRNLPHLSILTRKLFGIPATSASSERNFSTAGRIIEERRTRLTCENVDALLFLHNNM